MSLSTYSDLQSQITNWLGGRTDLTTYYADWITLAECHIARKLQKIRLVETNTTLTLASDGTVSLPSDYMGWSHVVFRGSFDVDLTYVTHDFFASMFPTSPSGIPQFFGIEGTTLSVMPVSSGNLSFTYFARNAALSSSLNSIWTRYPDAFLWAALTEAHSFLADTDQLQIAKARRDEILDEINDADGSEQGHLVMKILNGATP